MKNRKAVIALALFLGVFGAHRFYLRQKFKALLCLLFCWSLIPAFFGLCDAIFFFFMNDDDFNYRYNTGIDTEHKYCAGCGVKFSLLNMPAFSVNLSDGHKLCINCNYKISIADKQFRFYSTKLYDSKDVKNILNSYNSTKANQNKDDNNKQG
ncbi:MAG: TM2 domain-containing protein [Bacteroidales bacterium]|nr:TM2 domain-containing protein [Bacteroidales bacterium]